jgi:hypothetical protein
MVKRAAAGAVLFLVSAAIWLAKFVGYFWMAKKI